MKKLIWTLSSGAVILFSACSTNPPPDTPKPVVDYQVTFRVVSSQGFILGARLEYGSTTLITNSAGHAIGRAKNGTYNVKVTAENYKDYEFPFIVDRNKHRDIILDSIVPPLSPLTTDGRIFRSNGQPWRWKGVTAFKLLEKFSKGEDIQPFLNFFKGYNVLRIFDYVTWPGVGWEPAEIQKFLEFLSIVGKSGFYVELVLLTDDDPGRILPAIQRIGYLAAAKPVNLLLEIGNEPKTHKNINTRALKPACDASGFLYSSGDYESSAAHFGHFLTHHSARDGEWPRKSHDAMEFYNGGGPHAPSDPPHRIPIVLDEPGRPDEFGGDRKGDFKAYFASGSLFSAGVTFHYGKGRFGEIPTDPAEIELSQIALYALDAFPADAPNGGYRRIDEDESLPTQGTLSTYIFGPYMVRIRPKSGTSAPESGWNPLGSDGILWKR